jgi:hypothetical protein
MKLHVLLWTTLASTLLIGCSEPETTIEPRCAEPAPVFGELDRRAPGYLVGYHGGTDSAAETERIAALYDVLVYRVFVETPGFFAEFDDEVRAELQCEPTVLRISYNMVTMGTQ